MSQRKIQDVMDDIRKNETIIDDTKEELEYLQVTLDKHLTIQKKLATEEEVLSINLLKGKIKWIECDVNNWLKYIGSDESYKSNYYIYYYDHSLTKAGYFEGISELEDSEIKHFKEYLKDYFYYGYPNYVDRNHPLSEMTECELAFEDGCARYKTISYK